jgi:hypothetical protein
MVISEFNLESTPYGFRLHTHKVGCFRIFGLFFFVPGLLMLATLFEVIEVKSPSHGTVEWVVLFLMGLVFLFGGLALGFYRSYTLIDTRQNKIIKQQGLLRLKKSDEFLLDNVTEIVISRIIITDSDGPDYPAFPVILQAKNGHHFSLGEYQEIDDAIRISIEIAGRLGLKVYDSTIDGRPEIKSGQMNRNPSSDTVQIPNKYKYQELDFKWDGNQESLSRLNIARSSGVSFYKVEYPKFLISNMIVCLFSLGFFVSFFGWKFHEIIPEILGGFFDDNFLKSPEIFFSTIIGTVFTGFLLIPTLLLPIAWLKPHKFAIIGVGADGLFLHDPHIAMMGKKMTKKPLQNLLVRYSEIIGMDIKTKQQRGKHKIWKWEKRDNFIGLRVGREFYELGSGLDKEQLQRIAEDIKPYMMQNPR